MQDPARNRDSSRDTMLGLITTMAQLSLHRHGGHDGSYRAELTRRLRDHPAFEVERSADVDLALRYEGVPVGIEIDKASPGLGSLEKLRSFPGVRVLILRRGRSVMPVAGVDAVIAAPSRRYAASEAS